MIAATPFHADALAWLHAAAFPAAERWSAAAFASLLRTPGTQGWIAPAGLVLVRVAADEAEILTIGVDPARRRRGEGRALAVHALGHAAAAGARAAFLEVAEANAPALALYAGLGFRPVGRRPGYYGRGADALILRAPLPCGSAAR